MDGISGVLLYPRSLCTGVRIQKVLWRGWTEQSQHGEEEKLIKARSAKMLTGGRVAVGLRPLTTMIAPLDSAGVEGGSTIMYANEPLANFRTKAGSEPRPHFLI